MRQESAQHFETACNRAARAFLAPQQAQQHFGVKILAHLVDHRYIESERQGIVFGQQHRKLRGWRRAGSRVGGHRGRSQVCHGEVPRASAAVENDAALGQQLREQARAELGWFFDGQLLSYTGITKRNVAPDLQAGRAGLTLDGDAARAGVDGRSKDAIVQVVIAGIGCDGHEGAVSHAFGGKNVYVHHVVVDGESRDRSTILPHEIALRPSLAVGLMDEEAIVAHNVAVDDLDSVRDHLAGDLLQHMVGGQRSLRFQAVGKGAATEVGVAAANQDEVASEPPVLIRRGCRLGGGSHAIVRADERERGGGGEQLGVGGRGKEPCGVVRV